MSEAYILPLHSALGLFSAPHLFLDRSVVILSSLVILRLQTPPFVRKSQLLHTYDKLKYPGGKPSSKKRETYGLQEYPYKKSNVSCVHSMSTCNDTQKDIEGVATQNSCGVVSCERLNSVTTILAKRTGDTPHLGGDPIPTPTNTSEETDPLCH